MKIACVYHSIDLDGWMSAAIVKHWFIKERNDGKPYILNAHEKDISETEKDAEVLNFIGYNYGQPIPDLSEYDKVIMCDISFHKDVMRSLFESGKLTWIDHHISAIKENAYMVDLAQCEGNTSSFRVNPNFAACELTWKYFFPNDPMPEIVRLLGRYDCFGHKGTEEEQRVLEFQYGARQCISNYEEAYTHLNAVISLNKQQPIGYAMAYNFNEIEYNIWNNGKSIYAYLCTEAKQSYKNGFDIILNESNRGDIGLGQFFERKFICINKERFNPINFGIDYHEDGYDGAACFHYDGVAKLYRFSLYNDNDKVDCSAIAKQFGGGGHKGAAGFVTNDLTKIIK